MEMNVGRVARLVAGTEADAWIVSAGSHDVLEWFAAQAVPAFAAQQHLAQRGVLVPQHVSLVCTAPDPTFAWCQPTIAHIRYDLRPVLRRVVRWADTVARGQDDRRQSLTKAVFVDGGTVGPAKGG
jgi:hypothetical protein